MTSIVFIGPHEPIPIDRPTPDLCVDWINVAREASYFLGYDLKWYPYHASYKINAYMRRIVYITGLD